MMKSLLFLVAGVWLQVRFGTPVFSFNGLSLAPFVISIQCTCTYYTWHPTIKLK